MPQETNLNVTPYYDDFNDEKNFYRVLFKPGNSIQARELTTLQSILQNQIEKFGNHFFKEGARVIPGQISFTLEYDCIQVESEFLGIPLSLYLNSLLGIKIQGSTSGVTAKISNILTQSESDNGNITLYLEYEKSSNDFSTKSFSDGENLITLSDITFGLSNLISSGEQFAKAIDQNASAVGSAAFISEGVYFLRGTFVKVPTQTLILDQYLNSPTYRVGLYVKEEIITADQDESLYDNARGFSNYSAPGADRLKISAELIKKEIDDFNDESFVELMRIRNGAIDKFVNKTEYNIFAQELARRTFDESGNYYVAPFNSVVKESLNSREGNNGIYYENQLTQSGKTPSEDLMIYQISPGKAYISGYEVNLDGSTLIDVAKPRDKGSVSGEGIQFDTGPKFTVTNVYGQPSVGVGTTAYLSLRSDRIGASKLSPSGNEIGVARAYDFSLISTDYLGITTTYSLRVFDLQTFTQIGLSTNISLTKPILIQGNSSGARGYLKSSVSNSNTLTLYGVEGQFIKDEGVNISGITTFGHTIRNIRDYKLSDINSIYSYRSSASSNCGFNADLVLDKSIVPPVTIQNSAVSSPTIPSFIITPDSNGFSTVTSTACNFIGVATVGNIVSYPRVGFNTITYNKISNISNDGRQLTLVSISTVPGICDGSIVQGISTVTTSDFSIRSSAIKNISDPSYTVRLTKGNVSEIDVENTDIALKTQYLISSFSNNIIVATTLTSGYTYQPYTNDRYCLAYSDGTSEPLSSDKFIFSNGFKDLSIKNLTVASGSNATLIVSIKKEKPKAKTKNILKANTLVINKSSNSASGVGNSSLNDGLTYSAIYGTRIQDKEISLNVPDVRRILAIYESSSTSDPVLPTITFVSGSLTGPNQDATDAIIGEKIIGETSGAVAIIIEKTTNTLGFIYRNGNFFIAGENIIFTDSGILGVCNSKTDGDRNVNEKYALDFGQRLNFYDYSRIIKLDDNFNPTKKIKIVFQNYVIDASDVGDIVTVNSYPSEEYKYSQIFNESSTSDIIDIRPRVSNYSATSAISSPFEFESRNFTASGQSSNYYIAPNETITVSFSYYLPRIDRLFLTKEGNFQLQKGVSADNPLPPGQVDGGLEIATFYLPAFLYKTSDVRLNYASHKRYRMQDISRLETRISNLEYYTNLSLLETSTESLSIKTNGVDRFKCGFFVDNFKSHASHSIANVDFRASIDKQQGYLRPLNFTTAVDLIIGSESLIGIAATPNSSVDLGFVQDLQNSNVKKNGNIVTLNYTSTPFVKNEFATRIENVTPFLVVFYSGIIELNPSSDTWVDTTTVAANRVNIEGDYKSTIQQLQVDERTGWSETDWGAWQTDWVGTVVQDNVSQSMVQVSTEFTDTFSRAGQSGWLTDSVAARGGPPPDWANEVQAQRGFWEFEVEQKGTVTSDRTTISNERTTTTSAKQSRTGVAWNVSERVDTANLGERVVNTDIIRFMRSRNVEFISRKLKPRTRMYAFFDRVNVTSYCFPKLVEIRMTTGTFQVGETVNGRISSSSGTRIGITPEISFRVATSNHKYGPYNSATDVYTINPYDDTQTLSSTYSSTSSILNVDTSSLQNIVTGGFSGRIVSGMTLSGQTSGAQAVVTNVRLVSDNIGTLIGSFFIPDGNISPNPKFETGNKTFRLTTSDTDSQVGNIITTSAQESFFASGVLQTKQDTVLGIRNANVRKEPKVDTPRTISSTNNDGGGVIATLDVNQRINVTGEQITSSVYRDPLAQSFIVSEQNGVYATKLDLYFQAKDDTLPVIVQLRSIESGLPTTKVLPFSEVEVLPSQIAISTTGQVGTSVTFKAPVYLENTKEYAIVLLSDSTNYTVWISRMGEEDVTTVNLPESAKKIVSNQPYLGSLFKSQNGSTWEPSGYEDLKFTLYKAQYTTTPGTVTFYNPSEGISNGTLCNLPKDAVQSFSKRIAVGVCTNISNYAGIIPGVSIGITDMSVSGKLIGVGGSVSQSVGAALSTVSAGIGYTTFGATGISLDTITGEGHGLTADIHFVNNSLDTTSSGIVTVTNGGFGYRVGDIVGIPSSILFGSGATLRVQTLGSVNTLFLDEIQGNFDSSIAIGKRLTYQSTAIAGVSSFVGLATVSSILENTTYDGLHLKIKHRNHGMNQTNNLVKISGVLSDVLPTTLSADYLNTSTNSISVVSSANFSTFENVGVASTNPGYLLVDEEIISYTGVSGNTLTGISRGIDNKKIFTHTAASNVYKYEFNGVSLRRINKTHDMASPLVSVSNPISIDNYHIKINMDDTNYGIDRSGNSNGIPNLYFNTTKTAGASGITASQNLIFETITPNVQIFTPKGTGIGSRMRSISGRSVSGNEVAFSDLGFEEIELNRSNNLTSTRIVASRVNETSKLTSLPGNKSFTLAIDLFTSDTNVSPVIDLERVNMILTTNRIDKPITNFSTNRSIKQIGQDPHAAIYVSNTISLQNPSTSLKVLFGAYRHSSADIRVMYKTYRDDGSENQQPYVPFPGYNNFDDAGNVVNFAQNDGNPDKIIPPSDSISDWKDYEYTENQIPEFTKFSIKIIMAGTNQAYPPQIRDLRAIALA